MIRSSQTISSPAIDNESSPLGKLDSVLLLGTFPDPSNSYLQINVNIFLRCEQRTMPFNNEMIKSMRIKKEESQRTKERERDRDRETERDRDRNRDRDRESVTETV